MCIYIHELLNFQILKKAKVVAGKNSIKEEIVEWVSVMESPVENFVRQNEFVLTTGIGCNGDAELLLDFVKDIHESGASVLAIATGRHVFDIPKNVIAFAEEHRLVILELPWEIRFSDIVHEVMSNLLDHQRSKVDYPKEVQQHLIQMVLEGKSLHYISKYVEMELKQPVLIWNEKGEVVAGTADQQVVFTLWNQLRKSVEVRESHHPMFSDVREITKDNVRLLHFIVKSNGYYKGDFFILADAQKSLDEEQITIAEQAVVAAALWFSRDSAVMEAESRMKNEFLINLAMGEQMTTEHIESHAEFFRYELDVPYICLAGFPENLKQLRMLTGVKQTSKTDLEHMSSYIKDGMLYAAESIQRRVLYAYKNDTVIVYLETTNDKNSNTVHQFLDLAERRLSHLLPGVTFSWGIGKHEDGVWTFEMSFQKAKTALDMGRKQIGLGKRTSFDDTKINRLFLALSSHDEVQNIANSTLSTLLKYDEKKGMDLIQTFIVYKNNNENVSRTARELNLHRQSLLYRLRKIEALTELSFLNPDDIFLLDFSIRLWSIGMMDTKK